MFKNAFIETKPIAALGLGVILALIWVSPLSAQCDFGLIKELNA